MWISIIFSPSSSSTYSSSSSTTNISPIIIIFHITLFPIKDIMISLFYSKRPLPSITYHTTSLLSNHRLSNRSRSSNSSLVSITTRIDWVPSPQNSVTNHRRTPLEQVCLSNTVHNIYASISLTLVFPYVT